MKASAICLHRVGAWEEVVTVPFRRRIFPPGRAHLHGQWSEGSKPFADYNVALFKGLPHVALFDLYGWRCYARLVDVGHGFPVPLGRRWTEPLLPPGLEGVSTKGRGCIPLTHRRSAAARPGPPPWHRLSCVADHPGQGRPVAKGGRAAGSPLPRQHGLHPGIEGFDTSIFLISARGCW